MTSEHLSNLSGFSALTKRIDIDKKPLTYIHMSKYKRKKEMRVRRAEKGELWQSVLMIFVLEEY